MNIFIVQLYSRVFDVLKKCVFMFVGYHFDVCFLSTIKTIISRCITKKNFFDKFVFMFHQKYNKFNQNNKIFTSLNKLKCIQFTNLTTTKQSSIYLTQQKQHILTTSIQLHRSGTKATIEMFSTAAERPFRLWRAVNKRFYCFKLKSRNLAFPIVRRLLS